MTHTKLLQPGLRLLASAFFLTQLPLQALVITSVSTPQQLQNALTAAANDGDNNVILLASGYYTGNFNYNSSGGYNLTISNQPGVTATQITLDGAATGRDMNLNDATGGNITVSNITFLRNCGDYSIGALRIGTGGDGGSVILVSGCQFLSPANSSGMGLELASGLNATLTNCTVAGTTTDYSGTGISVAGVTGNVTVQNCTVITNYGYGLDVSGASVVSVTGSSFTGNNNSGASCNAGTITLSGNIFTGNSGGYGGGAGCFAGGNVMLTSNTFVGNYGYSGAAYCNAGSTLTISVNNFTGNQGQYWGGVYCSGNASTLSRACT